MYMLTKRAPRCSWCEVACETLHEHSVVRKLPDRRHAAETIYLCAICSVDFAQTHSGHTPHQDIMSNGTPDCESQGAEPRRRTSLAI